MAENWSTEELEASVVAYLEMRQNDFDQIPYSYRRLSSKFGRTEKAYEYRMQNISYVFSVMGREWVKGLRPAKNVGANVAGEIEKIINRLENQSSSPVVPFHTNVSSLRKKKKRAAPKGNRVPRTAKTTTTQYVRDAEVVAWVLDLANGVCECCGQSAPFIREDSTPYLEVHHLRRLADGGSERLRQRVYGSVERLIEE